MAAAANSPSGIPTATPARPPPAAVAATMITTTTRTTATEASVMSSVTAISGHSRSRMRCQVSPMVMVLPKTARPTTTVSMPVSTIAARALISMPGSSVQTLPTNAVPKSVLSGSVLASARMGPICSSSAVTTVAITTMAVSPSEAFGLVRMKPTAPL